MTSAPLVSVLMPVHNAAGYVEAAVRSVLAQTATDFDVVVVDDGSTDGSAERVAAIADQRIRLVRLPSNRGIAEALNHGMEMCRGRYVARMDADDVSLPARFEQQVAFLETHQTVGVCGTWIRTFGDGRVRTWRYPIGPQDVRAALVFRCPVAHPSAMIRSGVLQGQGLRYRPVQGAEDYDLWARLASVTEIANIPRVLLLRRQHPSQVGREQRSRQVESSRAVQADVLRAMGLTPSAGELELHGRALDRAYGGESELKAIGAWLARLLAANRSSGYCDHRAFARAVWDQWWSACRCRAGRLGLCAWRTFLIACPEGSSPAAGAGWRRRTALFLRCLAAEAGVR